MLFENSRSCTYIADTYIEGDTFQSILMLLYAGIPHLKSLTDVIEKRQEKTATFYKLEYFRLPKKEMISSLFNDDKKN